MEERPIEEYYEKAQELVINTQYLYYYREYVARGMQYQEAVTKKEMIKKACELLCKTCNIGGCREDKKCHRYKGFRKAMEG